MKKEKHYNSFNNILLIAVSLSIIFLLTGLFIPGHNQITGHQAATCGNGICETNLGEDVTSCQQDCTHAFPSNAEFVQFSIETDDNYNLLQVGHDSDSNVLLLKINQPSILQRSTIGTQEVILYHDGSEFHSYYADQTGQPNILKENFEPNFGGNILSNFTKGTNITWKLNSSNSPLGIVVNLTADGQSVLADYRLVDGRWQLGTTLGQEEATELSLDGNPIGNNQTNTTMKFGIVIKNPSVNGKTESVVMIISTAPVITPSCRYIIAPPTINLGEPAQQEIETYGARSYSTSCDNLFIPDMFFSNVPHGKVASQILASIANTQCIATVYNETTFQGSSETCTASLVVNGTPTCGDGLCEVIEQTYCPPCVAPPGEFCQTICDPGPYFCNQDCPATCGNGICDTGENNTMCPQDCTCGNGICEENETTSTCPEDCEEPEEASSSSGGGGGGSSIIPGRSHNTTGGSTTETTEQTITTQQEGQNGNGIENTDLCGNNLQDTGEDCSNCPSDVICGAGTICIEGVCEIESANQGLLRLILIVLGIVAIFIIILAIALHFRNKGPRLKPTKKPITPAAKGSTGPQEPIVDPNKTSTSGQYRVQ